MIKTRKLQSIGFVITAYFSCIAFNPALAGSTSLGSTLLETISISKQALFPESIQYNSITEKFIVGSFRNGEIYEIDKDGNSKSLVKDKRISSALGIQIDIASNRLFVATADIGASIRPYQGGAKKLAALGIYNLSTGEPIHFVNLGVLRPASNHLANGVAVDTEGNAYITDSFSPVIYKVNAQGKASVFLENERFVTKGINLNGLIHHPDGYLIVAAKTEGVLFKIPLSNPESFSEIKLDRKIIGADGVTLVNGKDLIVVANRAVGVNTDAAFAIRSNDGWKTAKVADEFKFGNVYPTTSVVKGSKIYALHSSLNTLVSAGKKMKEKLIETATIQQIGNVIFQ